MNQTQKLRAIQFLRPGAEFVIRENTIEWLDEKQTEPTEEELEIGWLKYEEKLKKEKIESENKRLAALAKLEALGLSEDDLKALGL